MADVIKDFGTIVEGTTGQLQFTIAEAGAGFVPDALYLTLYDQATGAIINSRNAYSLTPVSTYVNPQGVCTFNLAIADSVLLNTKLVKLQETHRVEFQWTWSSGTRVGHILGKFIVEPQDKEPDSA